MDHIFKNIVNTENDNKLEENLFVKNIIINKDEVKTPSLPYVATQRWLDQLGNRLEISY